jgi:hypothetical protein
MKDKTIGETSLFAFVSFLSSFFATIWLFLMCCSSPFLIIFPPIIAITFGIIALHDIKIKKFKGRIYAILGIIFGILEISLIMLGLIGIMS